MKGKSGITKVYGILFLATGILWLSVVFIRCEGHLMKKKGQVKVSYQKIQEQLTARIARIEKKHSKPFSLRKHLPKIFIIQFWVVAHLEFLCALLFLVSGIALLRGYPFGRHVVIYTLIADIIMKVLISTYQHCVLIPLRTVLDGKNILFMYFTPDAGLASKVSSYLTGIKLIQPGAFYYGGFYVVFLLVSFYVFTHPKMKPNLKKIGKVN